MISTHFPKLRIAISDCLQGSECRFNGNHAEDQFVSSELARFADYFPFCPEDAVIGTPRESVRLVRVDQGIRVRNRKSETDYTDGLIAYNTQKIDYLSTQNLDGAVVKSRSPSCGLERIKIFSQSGAWNNAPDSIGQGLFTKQLQERLPTIAIEEESRLNDAWLRENFVMQLFSLARWREFASSNPSVADLQNFHRDHKYLLFSKHEALYRRMGPVVAGANAQNFQQSLLNYQQLFKQIVSARNKRSSMINVIEHMYGYFKKDINSAEKAFYATTLQEFRDGIVPLITVMAILKQFSHHYGSKYLASQIIFNPYPAELALRSQIDAFR